MSISPIKISNYCVYNNQQPISFKGSGQVITSPAAKIAIQKSREKILTSLSALGIAGLAGLRINPSTRTFKGDIIDKTLETEEKLDKLLEQDNSLYLKNISNRREDGNLYGKLLRVYMEHPELDSKCWVVCGQGGETRLDNTYSDIAKLPILKALVEDPVKGEKMLEVLFLRYQESEKILEEIKDNPGRLNELYEKSMNYFENCAVTSKREYEELFSAREELLNKSDQYSDAEKEEIYKTATEMNKHLRSIQYVEEFNI